MKTGNKFSRIVVAIGLLSSATLLFETALIRFLAIAQFYHFAFLVVSLALLGFGASGTLISVFPKIKEIPLEKTLSRVGIGFVISIWVAFLIVNWLPFDSYSIAWERRQILFFILYYFSLSLPFLVSGLGLGIALAVIDEKHNLVYAANLIGSGLGVILAPAVLAFSGILGVLLCCGIFGAGCSFFMKSALIRSQKYRVKYSLFLIICLTAWIGVSALNFQGRSPLGIVISPYKELAYARRFPGATTLFAKWNAVSRVDVMADAGTRRFPGLSYVYSSELPSQNGLSIDGGALQPITLTEPADFSAGEWMPEYWAFSIQSNPDVLVLDPGAGLGILQALAGGAESISTVVENRLLLEGVQKTSPGYNVFEHPRVQVFFGNHRSFLQQTNEIYHVVFLPLTDAYQPVSNGVYSLSENYLLTEEGIKNALGRLAPGGVFVSSRWLQNPPSEGLRLVSTLLDSLKDIGIQNPPESFVIYRSIQTMTVLVKPDGWSKSELNSLRSFLERCHFDLVWAPDIQMNELNQWNRMPEPIYHQAVKSLFQSSNRREFYTSYLFNISPPSDNRPFFFHFFTWRQTPQIFDTLGKTWQPFGGSGYFLLIFLMALVLLLSSLMILLPLVLNRKSWMGKNFPGKAKILFYFGLIGIGFMFVEIPLISQWTLFLSTPIAAFTTVVGILMFSSGLGSMAAKNTWRHQTLIYLLLLLLGGGFVVVCTLNKEMVLGWPLWIRYLAASLGLSPLGFCMGLFFPRGISWIKNEIPAMIPWAWAINGSASVIASVATAILSLQVGYPVVLILGGCVYLSAWMILRIQLD